MDTKTLERRPLVGWLLLALWLPLALVACPVSEDDNDATTDTPTLSSEDRDKDGVPGAFDCNDGDSSIGSRYRDADGDGHGSGAWDAGCFSLDGNGFAPVGDDCNDQDGSVYPGAAELCDTRDNDCDEATDEDLEFRIYYPDLDGDGYGDPDGPTPLCEATPGWVVDDSDCNDAQAAIYPGALEVCDDTDNDCDTMSDEGLIFQAWHPDEDGDSFGSSSQSLTACRAPDEDFVLDGTDCHDNDASINPEAAEICNGADENCDDVADDGLVFMAYYPDADQDGYGSSSSSVTGCVAPAGYVEKAGDCDDTLDNINPSVEETCDGTDNNCDGRKDEGLIMTSYQDGDADGYGQSAVSTQGCAVPQGYSSSAGDCHDADPAIHPGLTDVCDDKDNDCDDLVDEDQGKSSYFPDTDGDGYGSSQVSLQACQAPAGFVAYSGDCDDADKTAYPGAPEQCDKKDNNCNGKIDDNASQYSSWPDGDKDGYGQLGTPIISCTIPTGYVTVSGDCDDTRSAVNPGMQEISCNGQNDDCSTSSKDAPDQDLDGYDLCAEGVFGADALSADCADDDPNTYPGAEEIPGDGIDEDCDHYSDIIFLVAGTGSDTYNGDNKAATSAALNAPCAVVMDGRGNLYLSDFENERIRRVSSEGIITTFGGNGTAGWAGDGGQATAAQINGPRGLVIDAVGSLYFSDAGNCKIRKIDSAGIITTVVGTGTMGFSGDGGAATVAKISGAQGLTFDALGNLYLSDTSNNRIRMVNADGIITTIGGTGTNGSTGDGGPATLATVTSPKGLACDTEGNLYFADSGNHRVRLIDPAGTMQPWAGTGEAGYSGDGAAASSARLNQPVGLALDEWGNLYVSDTKNYVVRRIDRAGTIMTVAGTPGSSSSAYAGDNGLATAARLGTVTGLWMDGDGTLFIADSSNNRVRKVIF